MKHITIPPTPEPTKAEKLKALSALGQALTDATACGVLDDLRDHVHPDTINAFCDGVTAMGAEIAPCTFHWLDKHIAEQAAAYGLTPAQKADLFNGAAEYDQKILQGEVDEPTTDSKEN